MTPSPFDTSGAVFAVRPFEPGQCAFWEWSDLSPFVQGYLEAALKHLQAHLSEQATLASDFADQRPVGDIGGFVEAKIDGRKFAAEAAALAFHMLSPSALEAVLRDCESAIRAPHMNLGARYNPNDAGGHCFWQDRQAGIYREYGPLHPHLSDDGKVVGLGEVAS